MEIVLNNTKSKYYEIFSFVDLDNIHVTFKKFSSMNGPLEANIFAIKLVNKFPTIIKIKKSP